MRSAWRTLARRWVMRMVVAVPCRGVGRRLSAFVLRSMVRLRLSVMAIAPSGRGHLTRREMVSRGRSRTRIAYTRPNPELVRAI